MEGGFGEEKGGTYMKVELTDWNTRGGGKLKKILSVCRDKECTLQTVYQCLKARPVPHMSILEHTWFEFLVEGLSIKARIQLLRHRLFREEDWTTMERSTRHINMSEAEFIYPATARKKEIFREAYRAARTWYEKAIAAGENEEDAAYILPLATETKFYLAANGRVWFEYLYKRLCRNHVQDEHYKLAVKILKELVWQLDMYDGTGSIFKESMPCELCKKCREVEKIAEIFES